jgi:hypothetical protein
MDSETTRPVQQTASQEFARLVGLPVRESSDEERAASARWVAEGDVRHADWVAADPTRRAA